jgi:hypothetical protein
MVAAMLAVPVGALADGDPRVQISSPRDGQQFQPGQTVSVTVTVSVPVAAGYLAVGAPGVGVLQGTGYNGSSYQARFTIPAEFAGPLEMTPSVITADGTPIEGTSVTIIVRSTGPPSHLSLVQATFFMRPTSTENIYVRGEYPNHIERDLTSSVTGTTYRSSDPRVVKVDAEGDIRGVGWGSAVVIVKNGGVKAFATVWVEDPAQPLPPIDVTDQLRIERLPAQITAVDPAESSYVQTLRISNATSIPIPGRLYVVVSDLPPKVVVTEAGRTKHIEPLGSLYFSTRLPDGLTLQPGQSASVNLRMWMLTNTPVDFTVRVFRSAVEL